MFVAALPAMMFVWFLMEPSGSVVDEVLENGPTVSPELAAEPNPLPEVEPNPSPTATAVSAASATSYATEDAPPPVAPFWHRIPESSAAELPAGYEDVPTRVLVRIDVNPANWQVGGRASIPIPHVNRVYTPTIVEVKDHGNGAQTWIAVLEGQVPWRFTITQGDQSLFAHLPTPEGTYELIATGELGWLMPSADMAPSVDYSVSDIVVPEHPIVRDTAALKPRQ